MTYAFDTLNLMADPYFIRTDTRTNLGGAPVVEAGDDYGIRPGGRYTIATHGRRSCTLPIDVYGTSAESLENNVNTLKAVLYRRYKRLVATHITGDDRFIIASLQNLPEPQLEGPELAHFTATFTAETPYFYAARPSSDVRTPTIATLYAGDSSTRGQEFSLTPSGSTETPLRMVITVQAGSVTPTLLALTNRQRQLSWFSSHSVAAGSCLVIDSQRSGVISASLSDVMGWWPLEGATSAEAVQDFSSNSRDLTVAGNPTEAQDGMIGACVDLDGVDDCYTQSNAAFALTSAWTLAIWCNPDVVNANMGLMSRVNTAAGYSMRLNSSALFQVFQRPDANNIRTASATLPAIAGQWYFVVGTWDGTTLKLYVNAELEA